MIQFLKQKNKKRACPQCLKHSFCRRGFTLVEVLVALFIFSLTVMAVMAVLARGTSNIINSKKKMAAEYLAQEGIEVVRNVRDTYALTYGVSGWNDHFIVEVNQKCLTACSFSDPSGGSTIDILNPGSSTNDGFTRTITVAPISGGNNEVKVSSTVTWNDTKSVTFSEDLFNWIES